MIPLLIGIMLLISGAFVATTDTPAVAIPRHVLVVNIVEKIPAAERILGSSNAKKEIAEIKDLYYQDPQAIAVWEARYEYFKTTMLAFNDNPDLADNMKRQRAYSDEVINIVVGNDTTLIDKTIELKNGKFYETTKSPTVWIKIDPEAGDRLWGEFDGIAGREWNMEENIDLAKSVIYEWRTNRILVTPLGRLMSKMAQIDKMLNPKVNVNQRGGKNE